MAARTRDLPPAGSHTPPRRGLAAPTTAAHPQSAARADGAPAGEEAGTHPRRRGLVDPRPPQRSRLSLQAPAQDRLHV